eukprot:335353-Amphidinium_carterae.2
MRPPPAATRARAWRYSDPPTGLAFDLALISQAIWTRLLPIEYGVSNYATSLYNHITNHNAFSRLTPITDILLTAFIHLGHVMQVHICTTPSC